MADYVSETFQTGEEVDEALTAGLNSLAAVAEIIDGSDKNKLQYSKETTEYNGITFTFNSDGTVSASGTSGSSSNAYVSIKVMTAAQIAAFEGCVLSGAPTTDGATITIEERGGQYRTYARDSGSGVLIPAISTDVNIYCILPKSTTVDGLVYSPMICTAAAWAVSKNYAPYRPSYQELYEMAQGGGQLSMLSSPLENVEEETEEMREGGAQEDETNTNNER